MRANNRLPGKRQVVRLTRSFDCAVVQGAQASPSLQEELTNLELARRIELPPDLFDHVSTRELELCRRRVAVEAPHELRRHPAPACITWLAAFVHLRARSLTDALVDRLTDTVHRIGARAQRKVERELLDDLKRITGKHNLRFELADAALAKPGYEPYSCRNAL